MVFNALSPRLTSGAKANGNSFPLLYPLPLPYLSHRSQSENIPVFRGQIRQLNDKSNGIVRKHHGLFSLICNSFIC